MDGQLVQVWFCNGQVIISGKNSQENMLKKSVCHQKNCSSYKMELGCLIWHTNIKYFMKICGYENLAVTHGNSVIRGKFDLICRFPNL